MDKLETLTQYLGGLKSTAVAFSGGADSAFLLKMAHDVLGGAVIAVTVLTRAFPRRELAQAEEFCRARRIAHIVLELDELSIEGFAQNPPNRCYLCKHALFSAIIAAARQRHIASIIEGSNADDCSDYRPGLQALAELGVKSPLCSAGLTKQEIRSFSQTLGLPTAGKQPLACLATRIAYGEEITARKLSMIEQAEQLLLDIGLRQVRVRLQGETARIETEPADFAVLLYNREHIIRKLKQYGFTYIALDLQGYRSGSMNETLTADRTAQEEPSWT